MKLIKVEGGYAEPWENCAYVASLDEEFRLYIGYGQMGRFAEPAVAVWRVNAETKAATFCCLMDNFAVRNVLDAFVDIARVDMEKTFELPDEA